MIDVSHIKQLMRDTGRAVMDIYGSVYAIHDKGDRDFVTRADVISHDMLYEGLASFGFPVLSEEAHDDLARLSSEYLWIIDPLDGTRDFVDATGEFSILIALVHRMRPVFGMVYMPSNDCVWWAQKGRGAYVSRNGDNDERICVSEHAQIEGSRIVHSRTRAFPAKESLQRAGAVCVPMGSAGLKGCAVADGSVQAYPNAARSMKEWDTCAPVVIIQEAGGRVSNLHGGEVLYNQEDVRHTDGFIASNGYIHDIVLSYL